MSEPIAEQIMAALRTRVATYRATTFRSSKIATWQPKNNTIHVFQEGIDDNPAIDCPGNPPAKGYTLNAVAAVILKPSDTDATAIDTYKNRSWAEVVKAITSVHLWHNWSGLAINTDLGQMEDFTGDDGSAAGVMVRLAIHFRTDENDPFVARS
jgi:hypothetical protein